jgi:hypothetical protein
MTEVLESLSEVDGWVDIAPPTSEELQETPSLLGFVIDEEGHEYPVKSGIVTSQEPSDGDRVEDMVSYTEYSTGSYTVYHREIEREVEIDGEIEVKPLPQVKVL